MPAIILEPLQAEVEHIERQLLDRARGGGGLVFAPNALVSVTTGVWVGNAKVAGGEDGKDTNSATLWGWVFGLGISSDLLAALGD